MVIVHDFHTTYKANASLVKRIATQRAKGILDPDELAQEAWLEVWRQWPAIRRYNGKIAGTVAHIANRVASWAWRNHTAQRRSGVMVPIEEWNGGVAHAEQEATVMRREAVRAVANDTDRRAVAMRMAGYELPEIGERLGVSRQMVQQRLTRAKKELREVGY